MKSYIYAHIEVTGIVNQVAVVPEDRVPALDKKTWIRIDNVSPRPSMGWRYDGGNWYPPA